MTIEEATSKLAGALTRAILVNTVEDIVANVLKIGGTPHHIQTPNHPILQART